MSDVFAGIALGLEQTYRIGDWVALEVGLGGRVVEITWRATRIETREGSMPSCQTGASPSSA